MGSCDLVKEPLVSVIIPVFNAESTVKRAIESIQNQTYLNLEIIVINDGSTDSSPDIIKAISFKDPRVKYVEQENMGLIKTLNKALQLSKGEYIAREDADDYSHADRICEQVKYLVRNPDIAVVGSNNILFGDVNKKQSYPNDKEASKSRLIFSPPVSHPSVLIRKKFLKEHNLKYDSNFSHCEDYALWVDIIKCGGGISNIDMYLHYYMIHEGQISVTKSDVTIKNHYKVSRKILTMLDVDFSEDDIELFVGVNYKKIYKSLNINLFKHIISLHELVVFQNEKKKIFNEVYLKDISYIRLFEYVSESLGMKGYVVLERSKLRPLNRRLSYLLMSLRRSLINMVKLFFR